MKSQNLFLVTRYTCKLLLRSRALGVFALLSFLCIICFQVYNQSSFLPNVSPIGFSADLRALAFPGLIPYMNIYLFSFFQSIALLFFPTMFLAKSLRNDSMDVIYYRPESNAEYIWGTILGFIIIFGGMALLSLTCGAFIHLFGNNAPFILEYYFFYYFTLYIPGLLFWLGATFCFTILERGRVLTVVLLFILFVVLVFYLGNYGDGVFDFLGFTLPNFFSQVVGHSNLERYLLQRGIWCLLGIGLLQLTVLLFYRLPNGVARTRGKIIMLLFLSGGILSGGIYVKKYRNNQLKRLAYTDTYVKFAGDSKTVVTHHEIIFRQEGNKMEATSTLIIKNEGEQALPEIIFYLNPALEIQSVEYNHEAVESDREYQVVRINKQMQVGDSAQVVMTYRGGIDENICYLDIPDSEIKEMNTYITCPLGKSYAFLEDDFTLLLPEVLWYPVTNPPVNLFAGCNVSKNFTCFSLEIPVISDKVVISQGEKIQKESHIFFQNKQPLTGISLCIGNYEVCTAKVDSVLYELYFLKGKFAIRSDSIRKPYDASLSTFISDVRDDCETAVGKKYPYSHFKMIEVPLMLTSYYRAYKMGSEYVQPELVFFPERGGNSMENMLKPSLEFKRLALFSFLSRECSDNNSFSWKQQLQEQQDQVKAAFSRVEIKPNLYYVMPMFNWQTNAINSLDYPGFETIFYLLVKNFKENPSGFVTIEDNTKVEFEASDYLRKHSLQEAVTDKKLQPKILNQIFVLKMFELINLLGAEGIDVEELGHFILDFARNINFRQIDLTMLNEALSNEFKVDLFDILPVWYKEKRIASYILEDFNVRPVGEEYVPNMSSVQVYFSVFNDSDADGIVSLQSADLPFLSGGLYALSNNNDYKTVNLSFKIPAKTGKRVSLLLPHSPEYYALNLNLCTNIPSRPYTKVSKNYVSNALSFTEIYGKEKLQVDTNEIVVDNEDRGFRIVDSGGHGRLSGAGNRELTTWDKYRNLGRWLLLDDSWHFFVENNAYGNSVKSAVIKKSGRGTSYAEWQVDIKKEGRYEVLVYLPKFEYSRILTKNLNQDAPITLPFLYTVISGDGENEITIHAKEANGWVSLGLYYFEPGEYSVRLSDKCDAEYAVVADAVKWVYKE